MTSQAQLLIEALKRLGLKHGTYRHGGEFTVETNGDALAHISSRVAQATVAEHADELTRNGFGVTLVYGDKGQLVSTLVSTRTPAKGEIGILRNGVWHYRKPGETTERRWDA